MVIHKQTGLEIIGIIPHYEIMQSNSNFNIIKDKLLYNILFSIFQNANKQQQRILITSIHPKEGKGFISNIISEWLFQKGKRCTIVIPYIAENYWWLKHKRSSGDEDVTVESLAQNDIVIMVLPPLLFGKYPIELVRDFNMALLVCDADRRWTHDDQIILDRFMEQSDMFLQIIQNKADKEMVEDFLKQINLNYYASNKHTKKHALQQEQKPVASNRKAKKVIKDIPNLALILDRTWQIVYTNETITSLLKFSNIDKTINRCISSRQCQKETCAVNSLMEGQLVPFNFKIACSLFSMDDEEYYIILYLTEIKGDKQKQDELIKKIKKTALESYEQLSALNEFIERVENAGQLETLLDKMKEGKEDVIDFNRLVSAENGNLMLHLSTHSAFEMLENAVISVLGQTIAQNRKISFIPPFPLTFVKTDSVIVEQILRTMLRNAFEAEPEGSIVQIGYEKVDKAIIFHVFNKQNIPEELQRHIFEKGFTTKISRRGLGTYSMKVLGERYLKAHVGFMSDKDNGTHFYISLPLV